MSANSFEVDDTRRYRFDVEGHDYYLIMDRKFCMVKYPYENRRDDMQQRVALERLCEKITEVLEVWAWEDAAEDE